MFELFNNVNAATFSSSEPATLYTAAKAVYGYKEMLNMEPAPFDYVPRRAPRKRRHALMELFRTRRTPAAPTCDVPRRVVVNG